MTTTATAVSPVRDVPRRRTWANALYGQLQPRTLSGVPRIVLLIGLVVAGTLGSLARTPMHLWNILWAEDGGVFISGALESGPGVIFQPYAGYLHLIPRLAAEFCVLFPVAVVPVVVTIVAALLASLNAAACFVFLETRIASIPLRFAAWLACFALPIMGGEVVNNLANLHWYFLVGAFCAVIVRSRSTPFLVLQCVVVAGAVLCDPLALLLLPLLAVRWFLSPEPRDRWLSIVFAVAGLVQLAVVVVATLTGTGRPSATLRPTAGQLLDFYTIRVAVAGIFGTSTTPKVINLVGAAMPGLVLAAVIVVLVVACRADRGRRIAIIACAVCSAGFAVIVLVLQWDGFAESSLLAFFIGGRYMVVPTALLLIALLLSADVGIERLRRPAWRAMAGVLVLLAVAVPAVVDLRPDAVRVGTPDWPVALDAAAAECSGEPADASVNVKIAPVWFTGMPIDCDIVEDAAAAR